jgi:hypothetical protein
MAISCSASNVELYIRLVVFWILCLMRLRHVVRSLYDRFSQGSSVVPLISAICEWIWFSDGACTHLSHACQIGE